MCGLPPSDQASHEEEIKADPFTSQPSSDSTASILTRSRAGTVLLPIPQLSAWTSVDEASGLTETSDSFAPTGAGPGRTRAATIMSFGNSSGGTLALPSPTHHNQMEGQYSVRSLRRSLSRSPSKFSLIRAASSQNSEEPAFGLASGSGSGSASLHSSNSSTPASPSVRRMTSQQLGLAQSQNGNAPTSNSLLSSPPHVISTPVRTSGKLSLRSGKSAAKVGLSGGSSLSSSGAGKAITRSRASPRSPTKRALNTASSSSGNSAPIFALDGPSVAGIAGSPGQENPSFRSLRSPAAARRSAEKAKNRHSMHLDMTGASLQQAMSHNPSECPVQPTTSSSSSSTLSTTTTTTTITTTTSSSSSSASVSSSNSVHQSNTNPLAHSQPSQVGTMSTGPLKRSDATMDMDQTSSNLGSPKAKRRSVGPPSLAGDLSVFDRAALTPPFVNGPYEIKHLDPTLPTLRIGVVRGKGGSNMGSSSSSHHQQQSSQPQQQQQQQYSSRAGSLRKTTLQQRVSSERTSWGRRQAANQLAQLNKAAKAHSNNNNNFTNGNSNGHALNTTSPNVEVSTPPNKNRPRLSLDHYMPPPTRDSPFSTPGPLPNPSVHVVMNSNNTFNTFSPPPAPGQVQTPTPAHNQFQGQQQRHPLARTMTTSSNTSTVPDDSPTHAPIVNNRTRAKSRESVNWSKSLPLNATRPTTDVPQHVDGHVASVTTPNYNAAKPFLGAFASTGLVSKMNRNPEIAPAGGRSGRGAMPDTPCKKTYDGFATYPPPPASKGKGRKFLRSSIGAPATPFHSSTTSQYPFGTPAASARNHPQSASHFQRTQTQTQPQSSPEQSPARPSLFGLMRHNRKSSVLSLYSDDDGKSSIDDSGDSQMKEADIPPTPTKHSLGASKTGSFASSLIHNAGSNTPDGSPTTNRLVQDDSPPTLNLFSATNTHATVASSNHQGISPKTPLLGDDNGPPDASRLTISGHKEGFLFPSIGGKASALPPATPTTRPDGFPKDRRAITPTNGFAATGRDPEPLLLARFDKVDHIGSGEFSNVYKVVQHPNPSGFLSTPTQPATPNPGSPAGRHVFAVKKLRLQMRGTRNREIGRREILALNSLRGAEHVLQLVDSWEEHSGIYIQTEYCEEGNLDGFLGTVGAKGGLDDFRVWKVLLELTKGLKSIHDAGFVHLDLKPENILITFEGVLKIGDFGMAASLSLSESREFEEGDRRYLAPETLRGEIGMPADVFSLGLIMIEIGANVCLPEFGGSWTALRENDFTEVPVMTPEETVANRRDAAGVPIDESTDLSSSRAGKQEGRIPSSFNLHQHPVDIFGLTGRRINDLLDPPEFMKTADHEHAMDKIVKLMCAAEPTHRPTAAHLLQLPSMQWIASRQRAGATVFEGNWGPGDEAPPQDTEMIDV